MPTEIRNACPYRKSKDSCRLHPENKYCFPERGDLKLQAWADLQTDIINQCAQAIFPITGDPGTTRIPKQVDEE